MRILLVILLLVTAGVNAQQPKPVQQRPKTLDLFQKPWNAYWVTGSGEGNDQWSVQADPQLKEYGVYKFRKEFSLDDKPSSFVVHVSGDNRYKLFVNGKLVAAGPTRGDLYYWNYETIDLAAYLLPGNNTIAALVFNDGKQKPEAQISYMTAFILQGNSEAEEIVNTNKSWKVIKDSSYSPRSVKVTGYYVAGPGENINMNHHVQGWEHGSYDDGTWKPARQIFKGLSKEAAFDSRGWMLVPSPIPLMELKEQRLKSLRNNGGLVVPAGFMEKKVSITIPANTKTSLLLDNGTLTNAYQNLLFSKGKDAGITLGYAEALYKGDPEILKQSWLPTLPKENRNQVNGKIFIGKKDSIFSNGKDDQEFTSLWWRTYRYIQVEIETKNDPLIIHDIYGTFTGYPFEMNARFKSSDTLHEKMMEIGWRTARLCAFETYMDCPYYEQLQYFGDARVQAMVSYFNSGDDRLAKYAIDLADHSRLAEGITLSRYPTDLHQQIPTFSLWWIGMVYDHFMYRDDSAFVQSKLPGTRQVLNFFSKYQEQDGSLKNVPYWVFTDWVNKKPGWNYGMGPMGENGESSILDIQLLWIYQQAAEMEQRLGMKEYASIYQKKAKQLSATIRKKYWNNERRLFADTEKKELYSQHANSLAILSGLVKGPEAKEVAEQLLGDTSIAQATIYFKYYLHQALVKAGWGANYNQWLGKWKENIDLGLTTWAEMSEVSESRSDCHAWGSSPNIEFFRTVLGIDAAAPFFGKVRIEPRPGNLEYVQGEMPHPKGKVAVSFTKNNAIVELPVGVTGEFLWQGKRIMLKSGRNSIALK